MPLGSSDMKEPGAEAAAGDCAEDTSMEERQDSEEGGEDGASSNPYGELAVLQVQWYWFKAEQQDPASCVLSTDIANKGEVARFSLGDCRRLEAAYRDRAEELDRVWWQEVSAAEERRTAQAKSEALAGEPKSECGSGWQLLEEHEDEPYCRVIVRGGYQDVDLALRQMSYCYWPGTHHRILRGTWFVERGEGQWHPVLEHIADQLEESYQGRVWTNRISRKRDCGVEGVRVDLTTVGSTNNIYALFANYNEIYLVADGPGKVWNYMTGAKPGSKLRRGWVYEKVTDYNERCQMRAHDSYTPGSATALLLATHGIGQLMPGSNIADDVSQLRETIAKAAELAPQERHEHVEVLPVQWRKNLHLDVDSVAAKIMPKTIETLRSRVHETAVEVLLYLAPLHHRDFVNSLTFGLNDVYKRFMRRNPSFKGKVSIAAHSLGSVISYDILCHQPDLFHRLVGEGGSPSRGSGDGGGSASCILDSEEMLADGYDWKTRCDSGSVAAAEATASMTPRSSIKKEVKTKETLLAGLESEVAQLKLELAVMKAQMEQEGPFGEGSENEGGEFDGEDKLGGGRTLRHTDTAMYVADEWSVPMGQAALRYPVLRFPVDSLFLIGSPLGLFLALKGVDPTQGRSLGTPGAKELLPYGGGYGDALPAVRRMYNVYHPCDPVAYRMEPLAFTGSEERRPMYMPYRGGKRLHIGTREFFENFGQNVQNATTQTLENVKASTHNALNAMGFKGDGKKKPTAACETVMAARDKAAAPKALPVHRLTDGVEKAEVSGGGYSSADGRIDFILQDGLVDNPYISAIGAHFGYFRCPDTALFISRAASGLDVITGAAKGLTPAAQPQLEQQQQQVVSPPAIDPPGTSPSQPSQEPSHAYQQSGRQHEFAFA